MDERLIQERLRRFDHLRLLTNDNIIVSHIANLYARGDIIIFEEALHQIIVRLCADYSKQAADLYRMLQMLPPPLPTGDQR